MARRRSKMSARLERRATMDSSARKSSHRWAGLTVFGVMSVVAALVFAMVNRGAAAHPTPRANVTGAMVMDASNFDGYQRVQTIYRQAKKVPEVLDGLHCYCECGMHSGHYSLLDCFKSEHGAGCDICLTEAAMAYEMHNQGKSLDEIRTAVDNVYANN